MKTPLLRISVAACALFYIGAASAREQTPEAVLRFDEAQQEEVADRPAVTGADTAVFAYPFAFKLNHRRVTEGKAYDAVTLWNVRRVKIKDRRMRLSDTTRREQVRLLKFVIEKNRKKGAKPHLLGNVGGVGWQWDEIENSDFTRGMRICYYTLRRDIDSVCKATGVKTLTEVPNELWRKLPRNAVYYLNGERTKGDILRFTDGLILRTLDIYIGEEARARGYTTPVVWSDTYPDRTPLVIFDGALSTISAWLKLYQSGAFFSDSATPMGYYYMLPVEAVETYGMKGMYGAICIDVVK